MKEEEGDETKQNCNNIHDLVTTKEEEGNHQHNNNIQGPRTKEEGDALDMLEADNKPIFWKTLCSFGTTSTIGIGPQITPW